MQFAPCAMMVAGGLPGCASPRSIAEQEVVSAEASHLQPSPDLFPTNSSPSVTPIEPSSQPPTVDVTPASSDPPRTAPTVDDAKALGDALATLRSQGAIDAAEESQLLDGLKQTDPALWPQLMTYFQSAATCRKPTKNPPAADAKLVSAVEPIETPPDAAPVTESHEKLIALSVTPANRNKPKKAKPARAAVATKTSDKSPSDTKAGGWQGQLNLAIDALEKQTTQPPTNNAEIGQHATLRLLYLVAGRREDALKPIAGIPTSQQDFWSKELYGLSVCLDDARNPDASRRAAEANNHFREAAARLGELATLQVQNLVFCTEVTSYGVYKPFEVAEFQAGQELLLYAEIENFKSKHAERGYHTALKVSYQILDERGARVDEKEFALTEEDCQNPRRDFFIRYFIWMPQRIYGGTYTLQLSVEDTLSQKIGQASIEFKIKGK